MHLKIANFFFVTSLMISCNIAQAQEPVHEISIVEENLQLEMKLDQEKPVMLIRLNRDKVFYKNSLKKVVSKALQIKKDAQFYIDVYSHISGNQSEDSLNKQYAQNFAYELGLEMMSFGVSQNNVIFNYYDAHKAPNSEIKIYVK